MRSKADEHEEVADNPRQEWTYLTEEFKLLRGEIESRSLEQRNTIIYVVSGSSLLYAFLLEKSCGIAHELLINALWWAPVLFAVFGLCRWRDNVDVIDSIARYLCNQEKVMGVKGWESFLFGQRRDKRRYLFAALHPIRYWKHGIKEDEGFSLSTNRLLFWFVLVLSTIIIAAVETMPLLGASVEVCPSGAPPPSSV